MRVLILLMAMFSADAFADQWQQQHNLDRAVGPNGVACDRLHRRSFRVDAPVVKLLPNKKMNLSFIFVGLNCVRKGDKLAWVEDRIQYGNIVQLRNSARSPAKYDWNVYNFRINPQNVWHYVEYNLSIEEVTELDQWRNFLQGEIASTDFKVYLSATDAQGRSGYYSMSLNLDPLED